MVCKTFDCIFSILECISMGALLIDVNLIFLFVSEKRKTDVKKVSYQGNQK